MNKKRIFIGIKLNLSNYQNNINGFFDVISSQKIKWTREDNLHLTFLFIGSIELKYIKEITKSLKMQLTNYLRFKIRVYKCGSFYKKRKNSILWLDVNHNNQLYDLQKAILETVNPIIPFELRDHTTQYKPHITIARFNKSVNIDIEALNQYLEGTFIDLDIDEVQIIESKSSPNGICYIPIDTILLK